MKLTFYLFEESVRSFDGVIPPEKLAGADAYQRIRFRRNARNALNFEAQAYLQRNRNTIPHWLTFFNEHLALPADLQNTTNSLIFIIAVDRRFFAVCMGYGYTGINRDLVEPEFGLRVALNSIDPAKIRALDARKLDNRASQKRLLLSSESGLSDFDIDFDEDLVSLISGKPTDDALARQLVGGDSLALTGTFTFPDLGQKCRDLLRQFNASSYHANFAFIDKVKIEKDSATKESLEQSLTTAISARSEQRLVTAHPVLDVWTQAEKFRISCDGHSTEIDDILLRSIYAGLTAAGITESDPHKIRITGLREDDSPVTTARPLYDYLVFETDLNGQHYLLTLNRWYRVASDYVTEVDQYVAAVTELNNLLPPIRENETEGEYNLRVVEPNRICLDKRLFRQIPGRSSIEVCDLLTSSAQFIIVKRYSGSATLSHMFNQGYVSAELLNDLDPYREDVITRKPPVWPAIPGIDTQENQRVTFIFALSGSPVGQPMACSLPFFSRVTLRNTVRSIKRMQFQVALTRIAVVLQPLVEAP